MWRLLIPLLLVPSIQASNTVSFSGHGFSFRLAEPEGWVIDTQSAPQIANFILHERGADWRRASAVVLGRLLDKQRNQTLEEFVSQDGEWFQINCPLSEVRPVTLETEGPLEFVTRIYDCPGGRHEMVSFAEVPEYFVVLVLSASNPDSLERSLKSYQEVLSSFEWISHHRGER